MPLFDPRVDAYIAKSQPFAQPILEHLRNLVHSASPLLTEKVKWGVPFFEYNGSVCQMAAFKQHCAFGFWKASMLDDPNNLISNSEDGGAGSFGRINTLNDLPPDEALVGFILQAIKLNEAGGKVPLVKKTTPKAEIVPPDYFLALLDEHPAAKANFERFSPSHKREYLEWIVDAKTDATREKRLNTTIEWLTEGKSRMWKYK